MQDLITAGLLAPGTLIVSVPKKWPGEGTVTEDGSIRIGDIDYPTPSAAAEACLPRSKTANGWTFWAVEHAEGETLADVRSRHIQDG